MLASYHLEPKDVIRLAEIIAHERSGLSRLFLPKNDKTLIHWLRSYMDSREKPSSFAGFATMNGHICSFHAFEQLNEYKLQEKYGAIAALESFAIFKKFRSKGASTKILKLALDSCANLTGDGLIACSIHEDNLPMQRLASACGGRRFNETKKSIRIREDGSTEAHWDYILPTNDRLRESLGNSGLISR